MAGRGKPKGLPRTGGRKKGTPNKRTLVLKEILESQGIDVPKRLARFIKSKRLTAPEKARILLELMSYLYPKRKAVEVTGKDGGPLEMYLRMTPEEREARRKELEKRLGKA